MKRSSQTLVFSALGVAAVFLILMALNVLAGRAKARLDLTQDRAFTLSPGTRAILKKVDMPVQVRLYATKGPEMPVELRNYAAQVEDLLKEYQQICPRLRVQKLDPEPDSDAEDSARLDGVEGQLLRNGDQVYLGLSVSMLDRKEVMPLLSPERERLLEYDITRAISQVITGKKPVIGILSPLQVFGSSMSPMMMQMGGGQQPEWAVVSELKRQFDVQPVDFGTESILEDIQVLLVIHPAGISEATQFAIDQFVLRGGKLVALIDPYCILSQRGMAGMVPFSTLDKLLPAWGLTFDTNTVVADLDYTANTPRGKQPGLLSLTGQAFDQNDIITGDIDNMVLAFAGAVQGDAAEGFKRTILIRSSTNSQFVSPETAERAPQAVLTGFQPSDKEHPFAIRLTGKTKTAFPDGKPAPAADAAKKEESAAPLKESAAETSLILIGDADFIQDPLAVAELPNPFGSRMLVPANGNLYFIQNAIEQLAGDANLISVRSHTSRDRPFTLVRRMQADAMKKYQSTIQKLEEDLRQTEAKLNELQQTKPNGQNFILSDEQQKELANFQKKEAEVRRQLKDVRRSLAREIDSLENRLEWINIALMPALVALVGLGLLVVKRRRHAAR